MLNRTFNRLSSRVSYGFAVALFSVFGGQVSATLGFLFILMITDLPSGRMWLHIKSLGGGVLLATLIHYVLFGLLRPWSRRWELPKLRRLNDWLLGNRLPSNVPTSELTKLTQTLEELPSLNLRLAAGLSSAVVLFEIYLELTEGTPAGAARFLLGGTIAVALYVTFVMVVTELTIRRALGQARRMLARRDAWDSSSHSTSLKFKLGLFVSLTAISLLMVISLFSLNADTSQPLGPVILFAIFILGIFAFMSVLIFRSIVRPLHEIGQAATHLVTTDTAELFSGSTTQEFIDLAQRFYAAGQQIIQYQDQLHELAQSLEQRVVERTAELQAHNAELDAFAHTVAHDLKNPLTVLVGFGSGLEKRYAQMDDEKRGYYLHMIAQNGRKMSNIIDELLLLASVRKQDQVKLSPLDLDAIVAEAQNRLAYLIEEHQAEIVLPDTWPTVLGYTPWVEEVLVNYLSNAIKYGGRPPRATLGATKQGNGSVRLWVRDNGDGLKPKEQSRLFAPFSRLHQIRAEGHGLGLSIVQRIVDKLGGQVGVESVCQPGEGCTFFFTLPGG